MLAVEEESNCENLFYLEVERLVTDTVSMRLGKLADKESGSSGEEK